MAPLINITSGLTPRRNLSSEYHVFDGPGTSHLFVVNGSRLYDLSDEAAAAVRSLMPVALDRTHGDSVEKLLGTALHLRNWIGDSVPELPGVRAISLNLAQSCNLACSYCYADTGKFGGDAQFMPMHVAQQAIDAVLQRADDGTSRILIGFMGGESLLNRPVLHAASRYAVARARNLGRTVGFSITTNATLLQAADLDLFAELGFEVNVSLDGPPSVNDTSRPTQTGSGSYLAVREALKQMTGNRRPRRLTLRATVCRGATGLVEVLEHLLEFGVDEAGFSPVLESPDPALAWTPTTLPEYLREMIACGEYTLRRMRNGDVCRFTNLLAALQQIHKGTHRPYPCGAGAGYLSVSAQGAYYACHRFINDDAYRAGEISSGVDDAWRAQHLRRMHVDTQEPCRTCWARYLCGGGCYHETSKVGRVSCDFIRGWLDFCLRAYVSVADRIPSVEDAFVEAQ